MNANLLRENIIKNKNINENRFSRMKRMIYMYNSNELISEETAIQRLIALRDFIVLHTNGRNILLNPLFKARDEEKYLSRQLRKARREYVLG